MESDTNWLSEAASLLSCLSEKACWWIGVWAQELKENTILRNFIVILLLKKYWLSYGRPWFWSHTAYPDFSFMTWEEVTWSWPWSMTLVQFQNMCGYKCVEEVSHLLVAASCSWFLDCQIWSSPLSQILVSHVSLVIELITTFYAKCGSFTSHKIFVFILSHCIKYLYRLYYYATQKQQRWIKDP